MDAFDALIRIVTETKLPAPGVDAGGVEDPPPQAASSSAVAQKTIREITIRPSRPRLARMLAPVRLSEELTWFGHPSLRAIGKTRERREMGGPKAAYEVGALRRVCIRPLGGPSMAVQPPSQNKVEPLT